MRLFDQMFEECKKEEGGQVLFANAMNVKGDNFGAGSLFMVLILQQQSMINQLILSYQNRKKKIAVA